MQRTAFLTAVGALLLIPSLASAQHGRGWRSDSAHPQQERRSGRSGYRDGTPDRRDHHHHHGASDGYGADDDRRYGRRYDRDRRWHDEHILRVRPGTRVVNASGMQHITEVGRLPRSVEVLNLSGTRVRRLPYLPNGLRRLDISGTPIDQLPYLPSGLRVLRARNAQLRHLRYLPRNLEVLDIRGSRTVELPPLPRGLRVLDVSSTALRSLPLLPRGLRELRARGTRLMQVGRIPRSVVVLELPQRLRAPVRRGPRWEWERRQRNPVTTVAAPPVTVVQPRRAQPRVRRYGY